MDSTNITEALDILVEELRGLLSECSDIDSCYDIRNDYIDDVSAILKAATEKVLSARIDVLLGGREYERDM